MIKTNDIDAGAATFFNSSFENIFEIPEISALTWSFGRSGTFVLSGENVNEGVKGCDGVKGELCVIIEDLVKSDEGENDLDEVKDSEDEK